MDAAPRVRAGDRPAVTSALLAAVVVVVLTAVLAACSGGSDDDDEKPSSSASKASDSAVVTTVTTIGDVAGGPLGDARRLQIKKDVGACVDDFLEDAYLGSFPRTDYTAAFADFTPSAAKLAAEQLDVLTNQSISDQITSATATNRRLRLTVFAPHGLARGVTARFVLDFRTAGSLAQDQRVLGQLYLTKPHGKSWQVFGFRVDQAVTR